MLTKTEFSSYENETYYCAAWEGKFQPKVAVAEICIKVAQPFAGLHSIRQCVPSLELLLKLYILV